MGWQPEEKDDSEVPKDLHPMQYGLHILEFTLGWPAKGNCELLADCISGIAKAKKLTAIQAYKYMLRAINLAKQQGITLDRMFFMNGEYMNMRPERKNDFCPEWKRTDWQAIKAHQETPEFKAAWDEMLEKCSKAMGVPINAVRGRHTSSDKGHQSFGPNNDGVSQESLEK